MVADRAAAAFVPDAIRQALLETLGVGPRVARLSKGWRLLKDPRSGPRLALGPVRARALILALTLRPVNARPWSWLGVRIRDLSEQEMEDLAVRHGIREGFGVLVIDVMADTPAARRGCAMGMSSWHSRTARSWRRACSSSSSPPDPSSARFV